MENIVIEKETTIQSYGEFWRAFLFLKERVDPNEKGWSNFKLSALTMACFTIEAFANHIGKHLFPPWDIIEKGISPIGKLKMFIEMKEMEIKYGEAPFNTVQGLLKWRNKVAHGKTEKISTYYTASVNKYDELSSKIEQPDWRKYIIDVNIERIEKDCKDLMESIHLKAFGNLELFLVGFWQLGSARPA